MTKSWTLKSAVHLAEHILIGTLLNFQENYLLIKNSDFQELVPNFYT